MLPGFFYYIYGSKLFSHSVNFAILFSQRSWRIGVEVNDLSAIRGLGKKDFNEIYESFFCKDSQHLFFKKNFTFTAAYDVLLIPGDGTAIHRQHLEGANSYECHSICIEESTGSTAVADR
jgi:hypothetical protein